MFFAPFCREICLWMGAIDASKSSAERALKANKSLIIYPGGSKEIFETTPKINTVTLVLKERKGNFFSLFFFFYPIFFLN